MKEWEVTTKEYEISFWGHENILRLDTDDIYTTLQAH